MIGSCCKNTVASQRAGHKLRAMKSPRSLFHIILTFAVLLPFAAHAQTASLADKKPAKEEDKAMQETKNPAIQKLLGEAQDLQARHRYFDALAKLDEAEKLDPKDPNIPNIRGAIYLVPAVRDFEKAKVEFEKALALQPEALAPQFNLGELLFVKHDFAKAEAAFAALIKTYPKVQMQVRHLIAFKLLICQARQDKIDVANTTLKDNFTFMDDTPAYYFSKAALAYQSKKEGEAKEWLEKANIIFKTGENAPYLDSLMEVRWVPNILLPPDGAAPAPTLVPPAEVVK